jgi:tetratricopeptide (TPR) repeat protein/tRNA A-37 threonylcarbamoyl transferase component Bud32
MATVRAGPVIVADSPADSGLPLGEIIPGSQYRVLAKLGSGGMGTVYSALHVALEKKVALKVLRSDVGNAQAAVDRLRDEARAASRIGSPYICDVTDFGQIPDGRVFFVMEYLDGPSLGRVLRTDGALPPERALPIFRQIAKALQAAHEKGIVHLDMKPDNVVLLTRGRRSNLVKLVDFGVARLLGDTARDQQVAGTPEYLAPERFLGAAYDHRADIYALGVLAYETLTGKVPFRAPSYLGTLTKHVEEAPPPLERRVGNHEIPEELAAVVMQLLEKDPASRPASMAVVEAMLCEAQIAARLRTDWDDLELPAVDDQWRKKLAARMPSPWGTQKKALVAGALALALTGMGAAIYFGALRAPEVEVRYVEITRTAEAEPVAAWLERAEAAARNQRYVRPASDCALTYILHAEAEHARLPRKAGDRSRGAERLRQMFASALIVVADELAKANLGHLAALKYRDALLFTPDDASLAATAHLSQDETRRIRERARASRAATAKGASPPAPVGDEGRIEEARATAANVYLLGARHGRFSEARIALKTLASVDHDGMERAKLADAFRRRADILWAANDAAAARPLYQLTAELDQGDTEAARRAQPPAPSLTPARITSAPASGSPAAAARDRKHGPTGEWLTGPRNPTASRAAAEKGRAALARLSLSEAEAAFSRALQADPGNVAAIGGLAEVAFERSHYPEALDYARRAVTQAPQSTRYVLLLGDVHFKLLRFADARTAYRRALRLSPKNDLIQNRLARVRARMPD